MSNNYQVFRGGLKVVVLAVLLTLPASTVFAAKVHESTVKEVVDGPVNGQRVVLKGRIIQDLGSQWYVFKDDTGTMKVNIVNQVDGSNRIDPKADAEINGFITISGKQQPGMDVGLLKLEVPEKPLKKK